MTMLKKNRIKVMLSSMIILLPMVFGILMWKELPEVMTVHWGADGKGDGTGGKAFAVFGLPLLLLVFHLACLLLTSMDKKQKDQNQKALGIVFWILPAISLFANGIVYRAAFGKEVDLFFFMPVLLGAMFLFMGNYLPKIKHNRTLGIRISWTLNNEENWNKTHRLSGKVWVIGGIILFFSAFLPPKAMMPVMICVIAATVTIPVVYSYSIYKKHQKEGAVYGEGLKSAGEKIAGRITAVILPILLLGAALLMFTGNLEVKCEDTALTVRATYWTDIEVQYSEIETVEYREELEVGARVNGFGTPRLSMGIFQNEEFGPYTLYAYTGAKAFVVLTSGEKTLVIGMDDAPKTREIYRSIREKTGE